MGFHPVFHSRAAVRLMTRTLLLKPRLRNWKDGFVAISAVCAITIDRTARQCLPKWPLHLLSHQTMMMRMMESITKPSKPPAVIAENQTDIKTMTASMAVMQLELMEIPALMFRN